MTVNIMFNTKTLMNQQTSREGTSVEAVVKDFEASWPGGAEVTSAGVRWVLASLLEHPVGRFKRT